jgi:NAD(P)-dependent dehydrogenase (short-subunit alcohol dehydrogenase family)
MSTLSTDTVIVVGASRGLGHAATTALAEAGADVVGVSRTPAAPPFGGSGGGEIRTEIADARRATVAEALLERYNPHAVVVVAGAVPPMRPLQHQSWETFSTNWQADVQITFHWLRAALLRPLSPGGRMIVVSSGAALNGSPLSGGYAGAKATQRFITGYAQQEAQLAGLDITCTTVLPQFAPQTAIGRSAVSAYAARADQSVDAYLEQLPFPLLTPAVAGAALVELTRADTLAPAYMLNGAGLKKLP